MKNPLYKVKKYCDDVLEGKIKVCRNVLQAVKNFKTFKDKYFFDVKEAEFAIRFIECLKHSKGVWARQNIELEPWQAFIIANIFGWKRYSDGTRKHRVVFISVGRKNGKSTLAAAIGLKLFVADKESGAEVYTAATKKDQAKIVHSEAVRMVQKCSLKNRIVIRQDRLIDDNTDSIYIPLGADYDSLDGLNVHGAILDEIHAHKTRGLWDVLETATGSRKQPLILCITTAGEKGQCIYSELKNYAIKALFNNEEEDAWFSYVATLDDVDNETHDPDAWIKSNPNLGVSISLDYLLGQYRKAKDTVAGLSNFKRRHLNVDTLNYVSWEAAQNWYSSENWYNNNTFLRVLEKYKGLPVYIGADFSSVADLSAVVIATKIGEEIHVLPYCWVPYRTALHDSLNHDIPYFEWAEKGLLEIEDGGSIDYEKIRKFILMLRDNFSMKIKEVAVDPHNARYFIQKLEKDNITIFEHRQTFVALNDPIKTTHRLILNNVIKHGNHPVLAWCVNNAKLIHDSTGNVKFDKKNESGKIDLLVAAVMAIYRAYTQAQEIDEEEKIYEKRGLVFI